MTTLDAAGTTPAVSAGVPVGLLYQMWETSSVSTPELVERALAEFQVADDLGYESVWVGEHHFVRDSPFYGRIPTPELLVAKAAAMTQNIRVGPGVKILSSVSAVRAAEEMCMLDILTGGRADIGIGQGSSPAGTPEDERRQRQQTFRDLLDDIIRVLRGDTSTGLPLVNVGPAPHLVDRLWAACRDDASIEHVAKHGLSFVVGQAEHAASQAQFVARYRAAGGSGQVRGVRAVYVAETREQALTEFREAFEKYASVMTGGRYATDAVAAGHLPAEPTTLMERMDRACVIVGGPDDVAAKLVEYVETTDVDRLDLLVQFPGLSSALTRRTLELFMSTVRPKLEGVLSLA